MTTPTAEMPMPGGREQLDLLEVLENRSSLYDMSLQLPKLAGDLLALPLPQRFHVTKTIGALTKDESENWTMTKLLHSMDPTSIRSIIRGTVAFDTFQDEAKWLNVPTDSNGKVPGVYVVGLSRCDHSGQFLNIDEIKRLIAGLEEYVKGYHALEDHRESVLLNHTTQGNLDVQEKRLISWVFQVDGTPGTVPPYGPIRTAKWLQSDMEVENIQALIASFKRRCNTTLDPSEKIRQVQSPIYVGCSSNLRERIGHYSRKGLTGLNKPMGLTVNILDALHLRVQLTVQVALRIWEPDQLPMAEQLVTTLASSLVYQHGFNATEAGGTGSAKAPVSSLLATRDLIMAQNKTMHDNLETSLAETKQRIDLIKALLLLEEDVPRLAGEIQAAIDHVAQNPIDLSLARLKELCNQIETEMNQQYEQAHAEAWAVRFFTRFNQIFKVAFGDLDPIRHDEEGANEDGANESSANEEGVNESSTNESSANDEQ